MTRHFLAALALFAAPAAAQTATFTAVIEPLPGPSTCPGATHQIAHNGALVSSSSLDLDTLVGEPMKFTATLTAGSCPVWDLTNATFANSRLTVCGTPALGAPIRFRVEPSGVLGQWALWWSTNSALAPIDSVLGTVMIAPPYHFLAAGSGFGAVPYFETSIPNIPALVGTTIFAQGARMDLGPVGPWQLTNPRSLTIAPATLHYILPNC